MFREQNRITDMLAKEGRRSEHFERESIFIVPPLFVQNQWSTYNLGTSTTRKVIFGKTSYTGQDVALNSCVNPNMLPCSLSYHGLL